MKRARRQLGFRLAVTGITALGVAMLAWAGPAQAYVRARAEHSDYDLIWPDPNVYITVYTGTSMVSPPEFVAAATKAAATWSTPLADTSIKIAITSNPAAPVGAAFDHENTISFRTSNWDAPKYPASALALTTIFTSGGAIVETDTEINAVDPMFHWAILPDDPAAAMLSTQDDLQNAITHELGHVLGLAHPCYLGLAPNPAMVDNDGQPVLGCSDPTLPADVLATTMFPTAAPGNISERSLSPDEELALRELYPAGRAPMLEGPAPEGPAGAGCSVADSSRQDACPLGTFAVFLIAVGIAIGRRAAR
jgi:hypothetical protein